MRSTLSLSIIFLLLTFCACSGDKKKVPAEPNIIVKPLDEIPGIYEAHGRVGEGTSMNSIEFITDEGDTLTLVANSQSVAGGVKVGDEVQIVYNVMKDENVASVVVNLTTLSHVWTQKGSDGKEQSLELDSAGRATTYGMSVDYDTWRVESGQLLLSSPKSPGAEKPAPIDTFEIMYLTADSLVLMHGNLVTEFERYN
ncbi:MAG: lipocalin family protein [Bacteroidaceae bacterium]|nr:lipocalin family protein [Bacteroidaceae bacterium]